VIFVKPEVEDHPEYSVSGQLVQDASDELLGDASRVARDEDVGVELPRELALAGDARHDEHDLRKQRRSQRLNGKTITSQCVRVSVYRLSRHKARTRFGFRLHLAIFCHGIVEEYTGRG